MIHFQCPNCQTRMKAGEKAAGQEGACSRCGMPVLVPHGSTVSAQPRPPASLLSDRDEPRTRKPSPAASLVWAGVFFLSTVFTAIGLYFGFVVLNRLSREGQSIEAALLQGTVCFPMLFLVIVAAYIAARALDRLTQ